MTRLSRRGLLGGAFVVASGTAVLSACTVQPMSGPGTDIAIVQVAPPSPRYEVVPVLPPDRATREYWQPGYWRWDGREYVWVAGRHVVRPRPTAVWVAGHWDRRGPGWIFVEGHWG